MTKRDHIIQRLKGNKYLARGLGAITGASQAYVRKVLADLRREGVLKQELTGGGRPLRYWIGEKS